MKFLRYGKAARFSKCPNVMFRCGQNWKVLDEGLDKTLGFWISDRASREVGVNLVSSSNNVERKLGSAGYGSGQRYQARGAEAHCGRGEFGWRRPLGREMVRQAAAGALNPR